LADGYQIPTEAPPPPAAAVEPAIEPPPPTASVGVHPFAISPEEGLPLAPQEVLLKKLSALLVLKNGAQLMYHTYADTFRGPDREGLYDHFEEHAAEERAGSYDYAMKLIALGGGPLPTKGTKFPEATGIQEALTHVIQYEKELIQATRDLHALCGEYLGLKLLLEDNLLKDQRHLDDSRRWLVQLP